MSAPDSLASTHNASIEAQAERDLAKLKLGDADTVNAALAKSATDPGALFEHDCLQELRRIRTEQPARYARVRAKAKELRVSVGELDRLTLTAAEAVGETEMFPIVEPWADPVNGAELLTDICRVTKRYVAADQYTIAAAALWAVFTHLIDVFSVSPIANITAPEMRAGKTIMLSVLGKLVARALSVSNIATAALFRSVEMFSPTLLIDEADSFLRENEQARGILNAGLYREGAFVIRCVGEEHTPTRFSVWAPKALCGIGKLANTLADRSIPLRLRRKTSDERVENLRRSDPAMWAELRSRIVRWADDNRDVVGHAKPAPIPGLHDRANDCWEPLLAVANTAGGDWPAFARRAAQALHGIEDDAPSINTELLENIREAFGSKERMFSADLLAALVSDEEGPWATWNRGKPMTARQLASRLSEFGIRPGSKRVGGDNRKGYAREAFSDAFKRYLSLNVGIAAVTPSQANSDAGCSDFPTRHIAGAVTDETSSRTASQSHCDAVAETSPSYGNTDDREVFEI